MGRCHPQTLLNLSLVVEHVLLSSARVWTTCKEWGGRVVNPCWVIGWCPCEHKAQIVPFSVWFGSRCLKSTLSEKQVSKHLVFSGGCRTDFNDKSPSNHPNFQVPVGNPSISVGNPSIPVGHTGETVFQKTVFPNPWGTRKKPVVASREAVKNMGSGVCHLMPFEGVHEENWSLPCDAGNVPIRIDLEALQFLGVKEQDKCFCRLLSDHKHTVVDSFGTCVHLKPGIAPSEIRKDRRTLK